MVESVETTKLCTNLTTCTMLIKKEARKEGRKRKDEIVVLSFEEPRIPILVIGVASNRFTTRISAVIVEGILGPRTGDDGGGGDDGGSGGSSDGVVVVDGDGSGGSGSASEKRRDFTRRSKDVHSSRNRHGLGNDLPFIEARTTNHE
ncbi:hypothetical protein HZH66_008810 [Vespula vulgaris]|uniref:Uncharacterized protein n=1 Tax=Vespula vulgaris TaxID=7454 RepID=A0A834JRI1_VESVU|nr:hypothetical protein HZH66_008810 [Vespula vulgaris]